jgi:low temperature requirement protein LtrA
VSWLELFFDLFFVVAVAQLSHGLAEHPTGDGFAGFAVRIVPIWFIWVGYTVYNERFESHGLENRIFTFLLMIPVIFIAVAAHDDLRSSFSLFCLSYAAAKVVIVGLWLRASLHVPRFRPVGYRYCAGFAIAIALAVVAASLGFEAGFGIFLLAVIIDVGTPWLTIREQAQLPRFSTSKLPERYGLFVMIVLGEMVVAVVGALADLPAADVPRTAGRTVTGVAIGFLVWWLYYDFVARRPPRRQSLSAIFWGYLHLPLVVSIVSLGAAVRNLIASGSMAWETRLLVVLPGAGVLIAIALLEMTLEREDAEPTHRISSPLLKVVVALVLTMTLLIGLSVPIWQLAFVLASMLIPALYGAWVWFFNPRASATQA